MFHSSKKAVPVPYIVTELTITIDTMRNMKRLVQIHTILCKLL